MAGRREQPRVFFPWERRRGVRSLFRRSRARQALLILCGLVAFFLLDRREQRVSDIRETRTEITNTKSAIAAFRADHDRACPGSLADLVTAGYLTEVPRDAWGRILRVSCPGRRDPHGFDVSSDGPDGEPRGLDRVE